MKNFAKRVSALVLALVVGAAALCPAALAAASLPDLPKDECVVDDANILSDSTTQTIVDLNNQLQSSCNGAQIGVLTVDYTGNYSTEDYATQAFNAWGIGSMLPSNNGVLILLVMESPIYEDGDYYVTYGDGFRNTTLESQASALAQTMENDFAAYDYDGAVTTCANNVAEHHCKCLWGKSEQWQLRRWQLCPAGRRPHHLWGYRSGYRDPVHVPDGDADHRTVRVPGVHCTHRPRSRLELGPLCMGLHGRLGPSALSSRPAAPSGPRLRPRIRPGLWPRPPQ